MEIRSIRKDIYTDPLTCLPNFFKFIEANFETVFGTSGVVIIFDIANIKTINETRGRITGDLYIKELSDVISKVLERYNNMAVYRTHADEITIICRENNLQSTSAMSSEIENNFIHQMREKGFNEVNLNKNQFEYSESINCVEDYYEFIIKHTVFLNHRNHNQGKLVNHIIGGIVNSVRETLSYYDDAYSLALVDDVSGMPNHRAGKIHLANLMEYSKNSGEMEFSILFIDGDDLRRYNKLSYETGNDMIKRLSGIIADTLRADDKIFRWLSGDEFLIVLKDASECKAVKVANRIRQIVEEKTKDWIYPVTISIGIATYPKDGSNITELVDKAEKANGIAKDMGKNTVLKWDNSKHGLYN